MESGVRAAMLMSVRLLLRPIVRLLLKGGVPFREFSDLAKAAYVDVASSDYGIRGRPTNVSRVAILTGINRRDVTRLRRLRQPAVDAGYHSPSARVLSGWHLDPLYSDGSGAPRELSMMGDEPSFQSLARRFAADLPHKAVLKELIAAGAVVEDAGRVKALTRNYIPAALDVAQIKLWGSILHDLGDTLAHNVARANGVLPRFERRAVNLQVRRSALADFRRYLEREGQKFLLRVDDWLTRHQAEQTSADDSGVKLGAGVYHIEETLARKAHDAHS
jgi:Family of unknown function (DUF6502)